MPHWCCPNHGKIEPLERTKSVRKKSFMVNPQGVGGYVNAGTERISFKVCPRHNCNEEPFLKHTAEEEEALKKEKLKRDREFQQSVRRITTISLCVLAVIGLIFLWLNHSDIITDYTFKIGKWVFIAAGVLMAIISGLFAINFLIENAERGTLWSELKETILIPILCLLGLLVGFGLCVGMLFYGLPLLIVSLLGRFPNHPYVPFVGFLALCVIIGWAGNRGRNDHAENEGEKKDDTKIDKLTKSQTGDPTALGLLERDDFEPPLRWRHPRPAGPLPPPPFKGPKE